MDEKTDHFLVLCQFCNHFIMGIFSDLFHHVKRVYFLLKSQVERTREFVKVFVFQIILFRVEAIVELEDFVEVRIASDEG